ncbi:MAG TPA: YdcF family protein [Candidatus Dormibacteraeota bacterium]|nr:YdcF family protein [Candidatus Dormibacteraeota bacterium]
MSAILILNGGANEHGELNSDTTGRIDLGMRLASLRPAATVIMVGGQSATIMRDFAAENYPEIQTPLVEDQSCDTIESAHNVKLEYLSPDKHQDVSIVTTDYHGRRAGWIFKRILGNGYDIDVHLASSTHSPLLQHKEQVQFAIARLKLLGLKPEDDAKRAQRLSRFRFRDRDNSVANLIQFVDTGLNTRLKA